MLNLRIQLALATCLSIANAPNLLRSEEPELASKSLAEYVHRKVESDVYRFEVREQGSIGKCRWLRLDLVSQRWQEVDWRHTVWMIAPDSWLNESQSMPKEQSQPKDSALLLISGGSWPAEWKEGTPDKVGPKGELQLMAMAAEAANSPAVIVTHIPFQPMLGNKFEDEIIAETFKRFLMGQGEDWPLLMPMVRAASKAMDAVQSVAKSDWKREINRFTITGASKRGWTSWLTSAVDTRVDALAPMVIDMLNMPLQMKHQVATWGTYSEQIADYTALELPKYLDSPPGKALQKIVDPYRYRNAILQPKLLIFGTNDRYWPLDACNLYWSDLQSPKYLLYVPNQPHSIKDYPRLLGSLVALHRSRTGQGTLPKLEWQIKQKADAFEIAMKSDAKPLSCEIWTAKSKSRDFRDSVWSSVPSSSSNVSDTMESISIPAGESMAVFGEWKFDLGSGMPASFTTNVQLSNPN
jgi:PhoPQ-activated pathogenicity-related protein